jgi:DNA-binding GntR family transcriptional regulator
LDGQSKGSPLTLVEYAADYLRESILSRSIAPGEWIRLDGIAQGLGMSPIPLREALRMLATEGLVIPQPHRGYVVAPATVPDLEEAYRIRLLLEPLAVRLAVPRLGSDDLRSLGEAIDGMSAAYRASAWPEYRVHHRTFHFSIYTRCNSQWLVRFADMLWLNTQRYQRMTMEIKGELRARQREHKEILAACRAGDAEGAGEAMHRHLASALESLSAFLAQNDHLVGRVDVS